MVYKCKEDGTSYYWKNGEIVGSATLVSGGYEEDNYFSLLDTKQTKAQVKIIETMVFNVLGDQYK
jgi:hypothetical protein